MGTRSLTKVYDKNNKIVVCMYGQYDGYPSFHGLKLAKFLDGRTIVNGYNYDTPKKSSNGMDCLAASMVAEFKDDIGNIYLYPTDTKDAGQDYEYQVYSDKVIVKSYGNNTLFEGSFEAFLEFCESDE